MQDRFRRDRQWISAMIAVGILIQIAIYGFVGWVTVKLLQHLGVV